MEREKRHQRRKPKNSKHETRPSQESELAARANRICGEIQALTEDLWKEKPNAADARLLPLKLDLQLSLDKPIAGAELIRQLTSQMDDSYRPDGFQEGRVYCFLCQSPECEHSRPADAKGVFTGYTTNGKPRWELFSNFLLHQSDTRAEQLYQSRPPVIAVPLRGEDLHSNQLSAFGKKSGTHHIVGQVVSGYFRTHREKTSTERWALSLQAVEYRMHDGRPRLDLNVVSGALGRSGLSGILTEKNNESLYTTVARARGMIGSIGERSINRRTGQWYNRRFEGNVHEVLQNLARFIERSDHQRKSRTRHAREDRSRSDRPVSSALQDTGKAHNEDICFDTQNSTIVVIGPHNRTHVFNPGGRLVTSINYEGDEVQRKVRTGQWRPATPDEVRSFRKAVASLKR